MTFTQSFHIKLLFTLKQRTFVYCPEWENFLLKILSIKVLTVEPIYRQQISVHPLSLTCSVKTSPLPWAGFFSSRLQGVLYRLLAMYLDLYYNGLFEFPSSQGLGYGLLTVLRVQISFPPLHSENSAWYIWNVYQLNEHWRNEWMTDAKKSETWTLPIGTQAITLKVTHKQRATHKAVTKC